MSTASKAKEGQWTPELQAVKPSIHCSLIGKFVLLMSNFCGPNLLMEKLFKQVLSLKLFLNVEIKYVVCPRSKCTDFLFKCLLESPEITSYLIQSMTLGKFLFSTDHSSTGSHFP